MIIARSDLNMDPLHFLPLWICFTLQYHFLFNASRRVAFVHYRTSVVTGHYTFDIFVWLISDASRVFSMAKANCLFFCRMPSSTKNCTCTTVWWNWMTCNPIFMCWANLCANLLSDVKGLISNFSQIQKTATVYK